MPALLVELTIPEGAVPGTILSIPHPEHPTQCYQITVPVNALQGSKLQVNLSNSSTTQLLTTTEADNNLQGLVPLHPFCTVVQNQCGALMVKNIKVLSRRPFMLLQFLLFPVLAVLCLSAFNNGLNAENTITPFPELGVKLTPTRCNYFLASNFDLSDCKINVETTSAPCVSLGTTLFLKKLKQLEKLKKTLKLTIIYE